LIPRDGFIKILLFDISASIMGILDWRSARQTGRLVDTDGSRRFLDGPVEIRAPHPAASGSLSNASRVFLVPSRGTRSKREDPIERIEPEGGAARVLLLDTIWKLT
jgi:hypothetical protein